MARYFYRRHFLKAAVVISFLLIAPAISQAQPFSDIPEKSPIATAAEYLRSKNIIQAANRFSPDDRLTRAQAAKVLTAPLVSQDELASVTASSFADVPPESWFLPYAEIALKRGIVSPASNFNPNAAVTKAAFIKMLLSAKGIPYESSFFDLKEPLSFDVRSASEWYFPVIRYALASSMTAASGEGLLSPGRELTRGDMALLYYRLDMFQEGRRTQALLSQAETEIETILKMLDETQVEKAEYAAARGVIAARGALVARPKEALVKAAVKISEGFQVLVKAYKVGIAGQYDTAIQLAKDAYELAEKAKSFSPSLSDIATRMQTIAKNMADEARSAKATP